MTRAKARPCRDCGQLPTMDTTTNVQLGPVEDDAICLEIEAECGCGTYTMWCPLVTYRQSAIQEWNSQRARR